ncbi:hypothetical protein BDQ17DRAFT_1370224 [Cyathus striatus]|nr:hypothetical protein BDQ17DRAFT_1370224 [Cyathus striatus]
MPRTEVLSLPTTLLYLGPPLQGTAQVDSGVRKDGELHYTWFVFCPAASSCDVGIYPRRDVAVPCLISFEVGWLLCCGEARRAPGVECMRAGTALAPCMRVGARLQLHCSFRFGLSLGTHISMYAAQSCACD